MTTDRLLLFTSALLVCAAVNAQPAARTAGATIIVPGYGDAPHANDEAHATFLAEDQDKDKSVAASSVNERMKQGTEALRHADPQGKLQTRGYYTSPVYADASKSSVPNQQRQVIGWRVGNYVEL